MTIEYSEKLDLELGLLIAIWLDTWLFKIKHDADPILVVVPNQSIVSVGTICYHIRIEYLLRDLSFLYDWSDWNEP